MKFAHMKFEFTKFEFTKFGCTKFGCTKLRCFGLFANLAFSLLVVSCAEPRPKAVRPPIDAVNKQGVPSDPDNPAPVTNHPNKDSSNGDSSGNGTGGNPPGGNPPGGDSGVIPSGALATEPGPRPQCKLDSTCKDFSAKEIALCNLYGGGDATCNGKQWSTLFYNSIVDAINAGKTACAVNKDDIYFRKTASFVPADVIKLMPNGANVEKISETSVVCSSTSGKNFYSIKWDGQSGFVCGAGVDCL